MLFKGGPSTQVGHVGAIDQLGLLVQFRLRRAVALRLAQTTLVGTAIVTVEDSDLEAAVLLASFRHCGMEQE